MTCRLKILQNELVQFKEKQSTEKKYNLSAIPYLEEILIPADPLFSI